MLRGCVRVVHDVVQSKVLEELSCKYLKHAACNVFSSSIATGSMAHLPARFLDER